jgi:hypothetical protein
VQKVVFSARDKQYITNNVRFPAAYLATTYFDIQSLVFNNLKWQSLSNEPAASIVGARIFKFGLTSSQRHSKVAL